MGTSELPVMLLTMDNLAGILRLRRALSQPKKTALDGCQVARLDLKTLVSFASYCALREEQRFEAKASVPFVGLLHHISVSTSR
jgi:hypothetical protein